MMKLNLPKLNKEEEPLPDIARCSCCDKEFPVSECGQDVEGDWETGYYDVYICPECPDGGEIDDYTFSKKQQIAYDKWHNKNKPEDS